MKVVEERYLWSVFLHDDVPTFFLDECNGSICINIFQEEAVSIFLIEDEPKHVYFSTKTDIFRVMKEKAHGLYIEQIIKICHSRKHKEFEPPPLFKTISDGETLIYQPIANEFFCPQCSNAVDKSSSEWQCSVCGHTSVCKY